VRGGPTRRSVSAIALVLALHVFVPALQAQPQQPLVLGYYVPYDSSSWVSLQAHIDQLDIVAAQWVTVDACGNLGSRDDQTLKSLARQHGVRILPSLLTLSGWLNHRLLTDPEAGANAIEQIVSYTLEEGYDGFDLDLEAVEPADRDALTSFVETLAAALHDNGRLLTLAIPAKERDVTVGWAGAYDYPALGAQADLVTVMAYEYRGPFSGPGSVAPYDWVERVTSFATAQIDPRKVLLGLAFYGYDWNLTSGATLPVGYPQVHALSERYSAEPGFDPAQRSLTFAYTAPAGDRLPAMAQPPRLAHATSVRQAPPCDMLPPPATPPPARPPASPPGTPEEHEVWLEDSASAVARLNLSSAYHTGGVATWRLGLEDPVVWPLFDDWRRGGDG
jgi:spore germination protein YaaH